jgi:hypothetical protein
MVHLPVEVVEAAQQCGEGNDADYRFIAEWARKEALREAAATARDMVDNEPDGYYGQACYEVARAIEARNRG